MEDNLVQVLYKQVDFFLLSITLEMMLTISMVRLLQCCCNWILCQCLVNLFAYDVW